MWQDTVRLQNMLQRRRCIGVNAKKNDCLGVIFTKYLLIYQKTLIASENASHTNIYIALIKSNL